MQEAGAVEGGAIAKDDFKKARSVGIVDLVAEVCVEVRPVRVCVCIGAARPVNRPGENAATTSRESAEAVPSSVSSHRPCLSQTPFCNQLSSASVRPEASTATNIAVTHHSMKMVRRVRSG